MKQSGAASKNEIQYFGQDFPIRTGLVPRHFDFYTVIVRFFAESSTNGHEIISLAAPWFFYFIHMI